MVLLCLNYFVKSQCIVHNIIETNWHLQTIMFRFIIIDVDVSKSMFVCQAPLVSRWNLLSSHLPSATAHSHNGIHLCQGRLLQPVCAEVRMLRPGDHEQLHLGPGTTVASRVLHLSGTVTFSLSILQSVPTGDDGYGNTFGSSSAY